MAGVELVIEEKKEDSVDRQKVCPFLLRVFVSPTGHHYKIVDYNKGNTPQNELQIYTWKDATLNELALLVKEVNPEARRKGTKFTFALVYPDPRAPVYRMREIGTTVTGQKGADDLKSLAQARFSIGDYMDIAISTPDSWNSGSRKGFTQSYNNHRSRPY
ncbi:hypothetical protein AMK59_6279 [Oryctes borbonicus]|uniref:18 kDa Sin3-associated polypeptide n=1 Tax=Oryctes borbonicus TaxID=1629725 RepID=A0A0T6B1Z0_9SCAR|nr:hypothetical protein AMK59_6279 [Oryctes borbonicus]